MKLNRTAKRISAYFLVFVMIFAYISFLPENTKEVKAATMPNNHFSSIKVSNVQLYSSGCLKSFDLALTPNGSYGSASGKIVIQKTYMPSGYLMDTGTYAQNHSISDWSAVSSSIPDCGFVCYSNGNAFDWTKGTTTKSIQFSDGQVNLNTNQTFYAYLWTYWSGAHYSKVYPDDGLMEFTIKDGQLKNGDTVLADAHTHSISYSANSNVIKAWCTASGCSTSYKSESTAVTVTLNAENKTYTGSAYNGASLSNVSAFSGLTDQKVTTSNIKYYSGSTLLDNAPVNVGDYTAKLTIGGKTAEKAFSITAKTPTVSELSFTAPSSLIYDGNEKEASVEAKAGVDGLGVISFAYYSNGQKVTEVRDAGTYTVKADIAEGTNYSSAEDIVVDSFTILKAEYEGDKTIAVGLVKNKGKLAEFTLPEIPAGASYGAITNNNTEFSVGNIDSEGKVKLTSNGIDSDDDMSFTVEVEDADNYNDYYITVTVKPTNHTHTIKAGSRHAEVAPSCVKSGIREYYECNDCDEKLDKDANVITDSMVLAAKGHTEVVDKAVEPTCDKEGLTEGSHCSVCGEKIVAQKSVEALGHIWNDRWEVIADATETTVGKRVQTCTRDNCGKKKYEVIPIIGEEQDPKAEKININAEVAPGAPLTECVITNSKTELLQAEKFFTEQEMEEIYQGADVKVWLNVDAVIIDDVPLAEKEKMETAAEKAMGEDVNIIYFDASLFKQVGVSEATKVSEPGFPISVSIVIPESLINKNPDIERQYMIMRNHNGEVTLIDGEFNVATSEFTFMTDRFSTYAIVYRDVELDNKDEGPKTGDGTSVMNIMLMMMALLDVMALILYIQVKEDR